MTAPAPAPAPIRTFETGANRDSEAGKYDYEGFLSPLVIEAFGEYMNRNRKLADGSIRDSDNWQKGIPMKVYVKSGFRHFFQWWKLHRGHRCFDEKGKEVFLKDAICGLLFNAMGYLHEFLKCQPMLPLVNTVDPAEARRILTGAIADAKARINSELMSQLNEQPPYTKEDLKK